MKQSRLMVVFPFIVRINNKKKRKTDKLPIFIYLEEKKLE